MSTLPCQAQAREPNVVITGTEIFSKVKIQSLIDSPPDNYEDQNKWCENAITKITEFYYRRNYSYARAWYKIKSNGTIHFHVDEGRVRVMFTGIGSVSAFFYRIGLNLPGDVFHGPTLRKLLEALKNKYDLLNIYYRVKEPGDLEITPFGDAVPQRVLQIYVLQREYIGWAFDISLDSSWGVLPGISYDHKRLIWKDDYFNIETEIAFPFRRYLFDDDPKFHWVHGGLDMRYRFPFLYRQLVAPLLDGSFYVSRNVRSDLDIESFHLLRHAILLGILFSVPPFKIMAGGGMDMVSVFKLTQHVEENVQPKPIPDDTISVRGLGRLNVRLESLTEVLRRDQRSFLSLSFDVGSSEIQDLILRLNLEGQLFLRKGRHSFIIRNHSYILVGDYRFWDEAQLAGGYQRVFFGNAYWTNSAIQLETAYRIGAWSDWVDLGFFHDLSAYSNRTSLEHHLGFANAFGPSLHLVLFDLFALNIYVGFGFADVGFDHTFSFDLKTIF